MSLPSERLGCHCLLSGLDVTAFLSGLDVTVF